MTIDGPPGYWAVNNHDPDCQPSGRPEIHANWLTARESLAVDMASWAAFVDGQTDRADQREGWPTVTERVEEVIGGELARLQPGSDFTATFVDNATALERAPSPSSTYRPSPCSRPARTRRLQATAHWVDRLGPMPEDPAGRLQWGKRAGTILDGPDTGRAAGAVSRARPLRSAGGATRRFRREMSYGAGGNRQGQVALDAQHRQVSGTIQLANQSASGPSRRTPK